MRRMSQVPARAGHELAGSQAGARALCDRLQCPAATFAHRKRDDHRLSPAEVLGQEKSRLRTPEQLHRIFYATRGSRAA